MDDHGVLALQRRRVPEVFVHGEVGSASRGKAHFARGARGRGQRVSRCVPRERSSIWCRGAFRAYASRAECIPGRIRRQDSCEVGVPAGVNIANRRFVVDEVMGTVQVFCTFGAGTPGGGSGAPDSHLFRVENGKLRYVHTLTHLLQSAFRGESRRRRLLSERTAGQGAGALCPVDR